MKHGLLLVDKPSGLSSHAVVARVRRALSTQRIGHAGTLDPMATGLLVLAIGEACKVLRYLTLDDKRYAATVQLGAETDSLDADGAVVETCASARGARPRARTRRGGRVRGRASPARAGGERDQAGAASPLHARVRRGEEVVAPERLVALHSLSIGALSGAEIELELHCGKGFYVRALARDLARALGTVGHLTQLRRTASGAFTLVGEPRVRLHHGSCRRRRVEPTADRSRADPDRARAIGCCRAQLDAEGAAHARHGRPVPLERVQAQTGELAEPILLCDAAGTPDRPRPPRRQHPPRRPRHERVRGDGPN